MMMNEIFEAIGSVLLPKRKKRKQKSVVPYKFNLPGFRNFHLLQHRSKRSVLNVFRPHWSGMRQLNSKTKITKE